MALDSKPYQSSTGSRRDQGSAPRPSVCSLIARDVIMNHYRRCSPREPETASRAIQDGPFPTEPLVQTLQLPLSEEPSSPNSPTSDNLPKPSGSRRKPSKLSQQRFLSNVPENSKGLNFHYRFSVLGSASEKIFAELAPDLQQAKEISITCEVPQDLDGHDPMDIRSYVTLANQRTPRLRGSVQSLHSSASSQSDSVTRKHAKIRLIAARTFSDDVPQFSNFADACNGAVIFVLRLPQAEQPEAKRLFEEQVSLLQCFCQQYFFQQKRLQASLSCFLVLGEDGHGEELPEELRQLCIQHSLPLVSVRTRASMSDVFARIAALIPTWAELKEQEAASPPATMSQTVSRQKSLVGRVMDTVGEGLKKPGAFFGRTRSVSSVSSSGSGDTKSRHGSG
eukprot:TRINITY_DN35534_c0_g1_i1.p1 TRINITY_DN35534_c0_g1~~TRINITY_DN35534_c0_g1_i1.p1  ORF type:complete len:417 (+),score=41.43 TRINITY_DN35534_c0_g1_i1:71-1252(+)